KKEDGLEEDRERIQAQHPAVRGKLDAAQPEQKGSRNRYSDQCDISDFPLLTDKKIEYQQENSENREFQFRNDGADVLKADILEEFRHYRPSPFPAFSRGAP